MAWQAQITIKWSLSMYECFASFPLSSNTKVLPTLLAIHKLCGAEGNTEEEGDS